MRNIHFFASCCMLIFLGLPLSAQTTTTLPTGSPAPETPIEAVPPSAPPAVSGETVAPPGGFEVPVNPGFNPAEGMGEDGITFLQTSPEGYIYDPSNRRDPFKPYGTSQQTQSQVVSMDDTETAPPPLPTDPLQLYDISQFRLVGIVWQVKSPKAVVRDPTGKMHLIYRDTKIGRNAGFVASIREGEVLVVEPTIGENGMPSAITRSMALKK